MHNLLDTLIFLWNTRRWRTRKGFQLCKEGIKDSKSRAYCVVPEKIHPHSMEDHWKFLVVGGGGGGVLKAKFLEGMYENKL